MPELPEVETIRSGLKDFVLNKKIVRVEVGCEKSFVGDAMRITQEKFVEIKRRGKALIFCLSGGEYMMVHLRMTGQMIYVGGDERFAGGHPNENFVEELPNKQTRVIFCFEDGSKMFFNDQRKFGFCKVMNERELEEDKFLKKLGKEPWECEKGEFFAKIHGKNVSIKAVLLDQSVIAGLGNIYTDEALYLSGVYPETKCSEIEREKCEEIVKNAGKVMKKSIELGGSTIRNYVKADGTRGNYLDKFAKVYGREGKKCEKCGETIKKIRVAGRGTYFCPKCQRRGDD